MQLLSSVYKRDIGDISFSILIDEIPPPTSRLVYVHVIGISSH